jgi:hypothetical protein
MPLAAALICNSRDDAGGVENQNGVQVLSEANKITCLSCKTLSYSDFLKDSAGQFFLKPIKPTRLRSPMFSTRLGHGRIGRRVDVAKTPLNAISRPNWNFG